MMILGLVRRMQPVHGYDVRRELLSWQADKWANVQPGSIYHALRKLSEEGMLREVENRPVGGRPARTSYEITAKGSDEFESLLRELWWNVKPATDPFDAAFSFLPALPREEAVAALRNRATAARGDRRVAAGVDRVSVDQGLQTDACDLALRAGDRPHGGRDRVVRAGRGPRRVRSVVPPGYLAFVSRVPGGVRGFR